MCLTAIAGYFEKYGYSFSSGEFETNLMSELKSIKIILASHKHNVCTSRKRSQYNSYTHDQLEVLLLLLKSCCVSVCRFDGHGDQRRHSFHNSSSPRKRLQYTSADREDGKTEYSSSKLSF